MTRLVCSLSIVGLFFAGALISCGSDNDQDTPAAISPTPSQDLTETPAPDQDHDGIATAQDCNDADPAIYPGAPELCDQRDNDCDGSVDEAVTHTYYSDSDADGYGDGSVMLDGCESPTGYVELTGDCDDSNASVYPDAMEICDFIDNDCDGNKDENLTQIVWPDQDADGYGASAGGLETCGVPTGYSALSGDCDDSKDTVFPNAVEICDELDNDCDHTIDEGVTSLYYSDQDTDGYGSDASTIESCSLPPGYATNRGDCDDNDAAVNPSAVEICDAKDNDCDGLVNEGVGIIQYEDIDSDGYGTDSHIVVSCDPVTGYSTLTGDCDDANASVNPAAEETCDSIDNNCDGNIDEAVAVSWYLDQDQDGFGNSDVATTACEAPDGYVNNADDCDDSSATINPASSESCDGIDNNCDDQIDEGLLTTYYVDEDHDGYGSIAEVLVSCDTVVPDGYSTSADDCDDENAEINPSATEVCDGIDNNCDGAPDDILSYYQDSDNDGFGVESVSTSGCEAPEGYAESFGDCQDNNAATYPGAQELCDTQDNDCDGLVDENVTTIYYIDGDNDGYGTDSAVVYSCYSVAGYSSRSGDCNDENSAIHPDATELCDGTDYNCNGVANDASTYYWDEDDDGFGIESASISQCEPVDGYAEARGDCADSDPTVHPGAFDSDGDNNDSDCGGTDHAEAHVGLSEASCTSIQEAVNAAEAATIVWVGSGSYVENGLVFPGTDFELRSSHGPSRTILEAAIDAIEFSQGETAAARLDGFTIIGLGAAIKDASPVVYDCTFRDIISGTALWLENSNSRIENCTFLQNYGYDGGGAMHLEFSVCEVSGCTFGENDGFRAGGAIFSRSSSLVVSSSTFSDNLADQGGAIHAEAGSVNLVGVAVTANLANLDGGGLSLMGTDVEIWQSLLSGNYAVEVGGALSMNGGAVLLEETSILANFANGMGGGIYATGGVLELVNIGLEYNSSASDGGGAYLETTDTLIENCDLSSNVAEGAGGALATTNAAIVLIDSRIRTNFSQVDGGALYINGPSVSVTGCLFETNETAGAGGAILLTDSELDLAESQLGTNASDHGGALYISSSSAQIVDAAMHENAVNFDGAGIYLLDAEVSIDNSNLLSNQALELGGALFASSSDFTLQNVRIQSNGAAYGAGAYLVNASATLNNTLIDRNVASAGTGGGLYIKDTDLSLLHCSVTSNTALLNGAGLYITGSTSTPNLQNSILAFNIPYNFYAASYDSNGSFIRYNDFYDGSGYGNHNLSSLHSSNKTDEPQFLVYDEALFPVDFHLATISTLINTGNLTSPDVDATRADMGIFGGSLGGSWDLDFDGYPAYFWPGTINDEPLGFSASSYDCDDADTEVQTCND